MRYRNSEEEEERRRLDRALGKEHIRRCEDSASQVSGTLGVVIGFRWYDRPDAYSDSDP